MLLADLARAANERVCFIAPDAQLADAIEQSVTYFAPELSVVRIPAWDCLPYDRASPSLRAASERLAGLHALQTPAKGPSLVLTTINAVTQKTLTPFRIRQMVARLAPGERIAIPLLVSLLQSNGYVRTDTVHDAGEYAVRGGIVDLYPSGHENPLRLDFFGDEIETLRRFDSATQRTSGAVDHFMLLPASEALLDEDSIKRFRGPLPRDVRRDGDRRSALPGGLGWPPPCRHGALAAAVRGAPCAACRAICPRARSGCATAAWRARRRAASRRSGTTMPIACRRPGPRWAAIVRCRRISFT